jgi:hypothetical protein
MSCCGSKRRQIVTGTVAPLGEVAESPALPHAATTGVLFVYDGVAGLIVTGRATGRRYRFGERGARVRVDARDAPSLALTPKLRRLSV